MALGSKHKADPSFNMSSMTDVVFLLLIFFIMTSSNVTPIGKKVNLPKSSSEDPIKIMKVTVTITPEKELFLGDSPVTKEALEAEINKVLSPKSEDKNENVIMVRGDVTNLYGDVMEIVQICSKIENAVVSLQMDPNK
jgi:biopolymer transport protein ExbD